MNAKTWNATYAPARGRNWKWIRPTPDLLYLLIEGLRVWEIRTYRVAPRKGGRPLISAYDHRGGKIWTPPHQVSTYGSARKALAAAKLHALENWGPLPRTYGRNPRAYKCGICNAVVLEEKGGWGHHICARYIFSSEKNEKGPAIVAEPPAVCPNIGRDPEITNTLPDPEPPRESPSAAGGVDPKVQDGPEGGVFEKLGVLTDTVTAEEYVALALLYYRQICGLWPEAWDDARLDMLSRAEYRELWNAAVNARHTADFPMSSCPLSMRAAPAELAEFVSTLMGRAAS